MSSLALMRWLESAPARYDAGMRALTLGRVSQLHEAVAAAAVRSPGDRVLEIGCGTGAVTQLLVARGARLTAIDQSAEMLERARRRLADADVEWHEQTAAEIDRFAPASFDAVVASLCLSDMSGSERAFVLGEASKRLRPGGLLVVADEVRAPGPLRRALQLALRGPQAAAAWLLVGALSRPLPDLAGELRGAGYRVQCERRWLFGSLALVVGERP